MNVVCIIQARMRSSRLPGKVLKYLPGGLTVLGTVIDRCAAAPSVSKVIVATTLKIADAPIYNFCQRHNTHCFKGSENDVLDRVYQTARAYAADVIVDITADCPLVDPRHIDRLVKELLDENVSFKGAGKYESLDYVSNCVEREWPDGCDIQVYTMSALDAIWRSPKSVREHVGWNIPQLAEDLNFNIQHICAPPKYRRPEICITLDESADYDLLKRIFADGVLAHGNHLFPVEWALDYLLERPELLAINSGVKRHVNSNNRANKLIEEGV